MKKHEVIAIMAAILRTSMQLGGDVDDVIADAEYIYHKALDNNPPEPSESVE